MAGQGLLYQEPLPGASLLRIMSPVLNLKKCFFSESLQNATALPSLHPFPAPLRQKIPSPSQLFCAKGVDCWCRRVSSLHEDQDSDLDPQAKSAQEILGSIKLLRVEAAGEPTPPSLILQIRTLRGQGRNSQPILGLTTCQAPFHLPSSQILGQTGAHQAHEETDTPRVK